MPDLFENLNEAQKSAVTATEGFVRVIAGAGSGKTRALSHRFAYLVNELGILPGNILCVTFTNKSANEMRQRIHNLTGDNDTGYINTFHGFCVSVLQEDSYAVQYPRSFLVLDNSDINEMLKIIYEERGLTLRNMTFQKARDMIEIRKCLEIPDYYMDMINLSLDTLKEKYLAAKEPRDIIFYGYLYQEKKCFGLDYNDLIKFSLYIFEQNEEIRLKWQKRLEYIMIDEFQDIDALQYHLMEVLCAHHGNLFIVGDPDQTIYTWRGADVKYLLKFDQNFPNVKTIFMTQNYRSTPQILAAANSLISKNTMRIKKDLLPVLPDGEAVLCHHGENGAKEAEWIAGKIRELQEAGVPLKKMTVLYRAHYVTRNIEDVFLKQKIPYTIYSGVQFFDRMEIKDALSYMRMVVYKDDLSFRRVCNTPRRNMGEKRMKFLEEKLQELENRRMEQEAEVPASVEAPLLSEPPSLYEVLKANLDNALFAGTKAAEFVSLIERFSAEYENRPVSDVFSALLNASGYEKMLRTEGSQERLDNLAELKQSIYEYEVSCGEEASLPDYLQHAALFTNTDAEDTGDKVKLMTVHTAKGLEFPYVFLCGMNEGIFPTRKTQTLEGMEEERRLCYVAMTRAEKALFLSEAEGRNFDGSERYPSRFLLDVDQGLITYDREPSENLVRSTLEYVRCQQFLFPDNKELFCAGDRVRHKVFGAGTVQELDLERGAYQILFDDLGTSRSIAFRVKLEKEQVQP